MIPGERYAPAAGANTKTPYDPPATLHRRYQASARELRRGCQAAGGDMTQRPDWEQHEPETPRRYARPEWSSSKPWAPRQPAPGPDHDDATEQMPAPPSPPWEPPPPQERRPPRPVEGNGGPPRGDERPDLAQSPTAGAQGPQEQAAGERGPREVVFTTPLWRLIGVVAAFGALGALGHYLDVVGHVEDFATVVVIALAFTVTFWAHRHPDRLQAGWGRSARSARRSPKAKTTCAAGSRNGPCSPARSSLSATASSSSSRNTSWSSS